MKCLHVNITHDSKAIMLNPDKTYQCIICGSILSKKEVEKANSIPYIEILKLRKKE